MNWGDSMSALICGSFAYDNIMVFHDRFKNHILPDKVHILNVSFLVPEMRREFGGCAGNIAYTLKLLGGEPWPMGTVGTDFGPYAEWMDTLDIRRDHVRTVEGTFTAQAFITTDLDDNQITAFHPGAMNQAHLNTVSQADGARIGIVSPDGRDGMLQHAAQFEEAGIPFVFDPGQGMPMFDGTDLRHFIAQASWVTVNDYEWQMMRKATGFSEKDVAARVEALVITRGGKGSIVYKGADVIQVPVARVAELNDPTGCGDAYRAGLLFGLMNDMDWPTIGRVAAVAGAVKMEHHGTQNHRFERAEFQARFKDSFGYDLAM